MLGKSLPVPLSHSADDRLRDEVIRALHRSGYSTHWNVMVTVQSGRVCLAGRVPTWHLRQVAQAAALSVGGVERVESTLQVC
ncbi:MAG: BON domain-containing protein [Planctomycetaceae bacterium]|nr:BON domain-containing protein [Planctomycetaceae bacterium]